MCLIHSFLTVQLKLAIPRQWREERMLDYEDIHKAVLNAHCIEPINRVDGICV